MFLIDFDFLFSFSLSFVSPKGHVCSIISEQKFPQDLMLIMQALDDTNMVRENGPKPNEFIDFPYRTRFHRKSAGTSFNTNFAS